MPVTHDALVACLGLEIGISPQKVSDFHLDGLREQGMRSVAQNLSERIGEGPWLSQLDDVSVGHGVSLLWWRSGGVEHPHDTPPYPFMPSPTSAHSSVGAGLIHSRTTSGSFLISAPPVIGNCCLALLRNAALHEAGIGPERRFAAMQRYGRYRRKTGLVTGGLDPAL